MRIGLLGGSFNPAHEGHRQLAQRALRGLQLDQVWLMVSPGNPLKSTSGMAPFTTRFETAKAVADGRRVIVTDIEQKMGERYTVRTLARLKRHFPQCQFVWLMGADGLASFARWRRWRVVANLVPVVVFPRPGTIMPALRGSAASVLRHRRCRPREASVLLKKSGRPGWTFLSAPQNAISSTALRKAGLFRFIDQK